MPSTTPSPGSVTSRAASSPAHGASPLDDLRLKLDREAERSARRQLRNYLLLLGVAWLGIVLGIVRVGWEIMEPVTFVVGGTLTLGGYAYFALTLQEPSPAAFYDRLVEREQDKRYRRHGVSSAATRGQVPPDTTAETEGGRADGSTTQRAAELAFLARRLTLDEFDPATVFTTLAGQTRPAMRHRFTHHREFRDVPAPHAEQPRDFEDITGEIAQIQRAVLVGDPGSGKTTTLRKLEVDGIARAQADDTAPVPLFIPLKNWT
ncbi:MAG: hypothetical protein ACRDIB_02235, partial [Ardenticatenaceae bacterium]